jgi:hypothetical protein
MPAKKYRKGSKDSEQHEKSERERPKNKPEGRDHQVHKEILERRMRGGPEPTPDAYKRALEQWKSLPGSIVRPPTDVNSRPIEEGSEAEDQGSSSSAKLGADDLKG